MQLSVGLSWLQAWYARTILDFRQQFRWSFVPPLMVYFAAGVSGLTAIVGTFFVKEYLSLSASFLAELSFWAGLPWALKMPIGHLVDVMWRWKGVLVYVGAALIAASLLIMYGLIASPDEMARIMPASVWYIVSVLLAPTGYVVQDAVADAMTVEAVPGIDAQGRELGEAEVKALHTTMQTAGRIALISGLVAVASVNILMFDGAEALDQAAKAEVYARVYLLALLIPLISVSGVALAAYLRWRRKLALRSAGLPEQTIAEELDARDEVTTPNPWYLGGGALFVVMTILIGVTAPPFAQEIVFAGSMAIVLFLMARLVRELETDRARILVGTAIIIFVFRAVPLPGAGATWFEIDVLKFDQQFLAVLSLIASVLTLAGMVVLRPLIASKSIAYIVVLLTVAAGILSIPNIGLYYGVHHWTAPLTGGLVDARFIAIIDTTIESPLGQIAMIPMLAWIARNAPHNLKATFFAVMASFTNLALTASSLATKYLNEIFVVTREVRDPVTNAVTVAADYSVLGWLLITVATVSVAAPLLTILVVQRSKLRTNE